MSIAKFSKDTMLFVVQRDLGEEVASVEGASCCYIGPNNEEEETLGGDVDVLSSFVFHAGELGERIGFYALKALQEMITSQKGNPSAIEELVTAAFKHGVEYGRKNPGENIH